jgi:thiol-disulfide isomerase/thioredoxin
MKKGNAVIIGVVILAILGTFFVVSRTRVSDNFSDATEGVMEDMIGGQMESDNIEDRMMENSEMAGEMADEIVGEMTEETAEGEMMVDDTDDQELIFSGKLLAGKNSPLIDFNKTDYEKALEGDKLVVLYFYANWCPTCKVEVKDGLNPAFNTLDGHDVIGFRINYNDDQTDDNERDLAREFGVAYQHTKVFLKNEKRILKSPETWSKSRYLEEINLATSN